MYCRHMRIQEPEVNAYLEKRRIPPTHTELDETFHVGGNAVTVEGLRIYLATATGHPIDLQTLRSQKVQLIQRDRMKHSPAVTAPLYDESSQFIGLHLRR